MSAPLAWVEKSHTLNSKGSSYTIFDVAVKYPGEDITHTYKRFSDFEKLDSILKKDLANPLDKTAKSPLAALPKKKMMGSLDAKTVSERMKGFQHYLETVSLNTDIYTHAEVKKFLSPTPFPSDADIVAEKAAPWSADYQRRAERGEGETVTETVNDDDDDDEDEDEDSEEGAGAGAKQAKKPAAPVQPAKSEPKALKSQVRQQRSPKPSMNTMPAYMLGGEDAFMPKDGDLNNQLRDACKRGTLPAIKPLVDQGADVNWQDAKGYTSLHVAAMFNHTKIVECLLEAGADPQVKAVSGETAIEVAEDYLAAKMRALVASQ